MPRSFLGVEENAEEQSDGVCAVVKHTDSSLVSWAHILALLLMSAGILCKFLYPPVPPLPHL